jgi:Putative prokaryotic signal transducing protein
MRAYNRSMRDAKLIVVQSCSNQIEAELAKGALESAGIAAMIQADTAGRMREHLAWSGAGFKILVREEDAAAARDVLAPQPQIVEDTDADDDPPPTGRRFS